MSDENLRKAVEIFKILSDTTRIRILLSIGEGEKCVHEIADETESKLSNVSHHLRRMKDKGLVNFRKEGRHKYYRIVDEKVVDIVNQGVELAE